MDTATTATTACTTQGCTAAPEARLRLIRSGREFLVCVDDAVRSYDAIDPRRRGDRIEVLNL